MLAAAAVFAIALSVTQTSVATGKTLPWNFWTTMGLFSLATGAATLSMGLHRGLWRYASLPELLAIVKSTGIVVFGFAAADAIFQLFHTTGGSASPALIVAASLMIIAMGGTRLLYRLWRNRRVRSHRRSRGLDRNVILVSAGAEAEAFIKFVNEHPAPNLNVVAVFDERDRRSGLSIRGVPILGDTEAVASLCRSAASGNARIDGLVLTRRTYCYPDALIERLIGVAQESQLELLHLPPVGELACQSASDRCDERGLSLQPLSIENLLGRPPVRINASRLRTLVAGEVVLVTGAGGSIGTELSRQIANLRPAKLILVELSELALYQVEQEIRSLTDGTTTQIVPLLGDVRDRQQMMDLLGYWRPTLVFHAAALKHVPIVELQPLEGVRTNLIGTRNVADAACRASVRAMVILSTDKAVRPTSIMGAAKRLAEIYCQALDLDHSTRFVTVRFGNVLGSAGSVVPLFQKQISAGGPVTVTHPEITRFFMTIPEATQLVLHAMQYVVDHATSRGRIYALDMGAPVKIADLARRMIVLRGLRPDIDIPIVYTGLRPGEKLHEELFALAENPAGTDAAGIIVGSSPTYATEHVCKVIDAIYANICAANTHGALTKLAAAVPESQLTIPPPDNPRRENLVSFPRVVPA